MNIKSRSTPTKTTRYTLLPFATAAVTLFAGTSALAATWTGNGNINWSTSANWSGTAPVINFSDTLSFAGTNNVGTAGTPLSNNLTGGTVTSLTFNSGAGAFFLGGNAINLAGNLTNNSTTNQTVNLNLTLTGATRQLNAASGNLTFGGTIATNGQILDFRGNNNIAATGAVSGSGSLQHFGGGIVTLSGANAVSGATEVRVQGAGTLDLGSSGSVSAVGIFTQGGGTLRISGGTLTSSGDMITAFNSSDVGTVNVSGTANVSTARFGVTNNGTGTVNVSGSASVVGTEIKVASGGTSIGILNQSGGLVRATNGFGFYLTQFSGANGTYNLSGGELQTNVWQANAAGSTGVFNFSGGTIRAFNSNLTINSALTLTGDNGVLNSTDSVGTAWTLTVAQAIGESGGAHGLTFAGTGTTVLSAVNTFTGTTTVNGGTLATGATGTFGAGNVDVAAGAKLTFGNNASIGDLSNLRFTTTSKINLNFSGSETVGSLYNSVTGISIAAGTYDVAFLNSTFGSGIFASTGSGTLTVTASAIPEPTTYAALAGVGILALAVYRRRSA